MKDELPEFNFKTAVRPNGSYIAVMECGKDVVGLDRVTATRWAFGLMAVVVIAEFEAAVAKQMMSIGNLESVQTILADLRERRSPLNQEDTRPLKIVPGVNAQLEPFLTCTWEGRTEYADFKWELDDAKQYALYAMEMVTGADQDELYYNVLTNVVGINIDQARSTVADLRNYR